MENYTSKEIYRFGNGLNMDISDVYIPYSEWIAEYNLLELLNVENDFFVKGNFPKILISTIPYKLN